MAGYIMKRNITFEKLEHSLGRSSGKKSRKSPGGDNVFTSGRDQTNPQNSSMTASTGPF